MMRANQTSPNQPADRLPSHRCIKQSITMKMPQFATISPNEFGAAKSMNL